MNRTDRLYALVEELRAVSPRTRSAAWLARRFEVSVRTVERDLGALREAGVPIWAEPGRTGGYGLDRNRTLPPLAFTVDEALAISVALRSAERSPFASAAASARKVLAGLPTDVRMAQDEVAARLHLVGEVRPRHMVTTRCAPLRTGGSCGCGMSMPAARPQFGKSSR